MLKADPNALSRAGARRSQRGEMSGGVEGVADGFADKPCVRENRCGLRRGEEYGGE